MTTNQQLAQVVVEIAKAKTLRKTTATKADTTHIEAEWKTLKDGIEASKNQRDSLVAQLVVQSP